VHSVLRHQLPERREWSLGEDPIEVKPAGREADGSVALWLNSPPIPGIAVGPTGPLGERCGPRNSRTTAHLNCWLLGTALAAQSSGLQNRSVESSACSGNCKRLQSLCGRSASNSIQLENSPAPSDERRYEVARILRAGQKVWTTLRPLAEQDRAYSSAFPSLKPPPFQPALGGFVPPAPGPAPTCWTEPVRRTARITVWVEVACLGVNQWWELGVREPRLAGFNDERPRGGCLSASYRGESLRVPLPPGGQRLGFWRSCSRSRITPTAGRVSRGRNHPGAVGAGDGAGAAAKES